jgi:hypothetical protein
VQCKTFKTIVPREELDSGFESARARGHMFVCILWKQSYMKIAPGYGRAQTACITKGIVMHIGH